MKRRLSGIFGIALVFAAVCTCTATEESFLADVQALTRASHRLSGTPEGKAAATYIKQRLQQIGITDINLLDMPVWQTRVNQCQLLVDGRNVDLLPLRPDILAPPVTPPEGLSGPLLYAGRGELADYGTRSANGAIVVLEYDSFDNWKRAFSMGAKAVIFLGDDHSAPAAPKNYGLPSNFARLYATPEVQKLVDLRRDRAQVAVMSQVPWNLSTGENILGYLPGTNPTFDPARGPETLVLGANYDSFGIVPNDSPDARGAANVAAVLEAAEYFKQHRPRRNIVFMFLDDEARFHQGGRDVYSSLMQKPREAATISADHKAEAAFVVRMLKLLDHESLQFDEDPSIRFTALNILKKQAESMSSDLQQDLLKIRMNIRRTQDQAARRELEARRVKLTAEISAWDMTRRALHKGTPEKIDPAVYSALRKATLDRFETRKQELDLAILADGERDTLRNGLGKQWIVLHAAYNLSDRGPCWGVVVGDDTYRELYGVDAASDKPGYYGRVLGAFREAAAQLPPGVAPSPDTLQDPLLGMQFAATQSISNGQPAGTFGIYNIQLMTGYDARPRDGHPSDTLENLDWKTLRSYALNATLTLELVANGNSISLPRTFSNQGKSQLPLWDNGLSTGNYAALMSTGSVAEDHPASGALMTMWGYNGVRIWEVQTAGSTLPYFDRFITEPVDMNGRFALRGVSRDVFKQFVTLGALTDDIGGIKAITSQDTIYTQSADVVTRVNLFPSIGAGVPYTLVSTTKNFPLNVLDAATDAATLKTRSLVGQPNDNYTQKDDSAFFYLFSRGSTERVKIFQAQGPVLMNSSREHPLGTGFPLAELKTPLPIDDTTAHDLWRLNESRLSILRSRGVNNVSLEILHGKALRALENADKVDTVEKKLAAFSQSTLLSRRIYPELRAAMDDLVHAVVLLLLLTIPFSFAMERLIFCASGIYARLAGFAGIFLATFTLLFFMHPGFSVASAPTIILLAFAIILLSSLVIFIVVRKFKDELKETQGQSGRLHSLQVSHMGTLLAAVNMGMSTMRRRPSRTILTIITVVLLTFTILCFASFSTGIGLRVSYQGPAAEGSPAAAFMRQLDYKLMPPNLPDVLRGSEGPGGFLASEWWLSRTHPDKDPPFSLVRPDGNNRDVVWFDSVMGITPGELERWPELAASLIGTDTAAKMTALKNGGVFLPPSTMDRLSLKVGDPVLLHGSRMFVAGALNINILERLKHLDGRSVLPVDFVSAAAATPESTQVDAKPDVEDLSQRDFLRLSPEQICIVSADQVRAMNGNLHVITLYSAPDQSLSITGRALAEIVPLPVWARSTTGIEQLFFTKVTELKGGLVLIVPVLLGGLIIFGTLLGSISDREKEIYTFSALGLSPTHVGFLFFSEAAVYAVVGGLGGQLLTQAVALGASTLARMGYLHAPALNYSSGNAIFANLIVMLTVLISAAYPAYRASRSANPGVQRAWKLPAPDGDEMRMVFPFTVSAYDITGVISFLAEHFRSHEDAGLGIFAAQDVTIGRDINTGYLLLSAHLALAPFDLGVTQSFDLTAVPSEIPGVDEIVIHSTRRSGNRQDWIRANRVFVQDLRRQFLLWRTLSAEMIESYRMETLQALDERKAPAPQMEIVT